MLDSSSVLLAFLFRISTLEGSVRSKRYLEIKAIVAIVPAGSSGALLQISVASFCRMSHQRVVDPIAFGSDAMLQGSL